MNQDEKKENRTNMRGSIPTIRSSWNQFNNKGFEELEQEYYINNLLDTGFQ